MLTQKYCWFETNYPLVALIREKSSLCSHLPFISGCMEMFVQLSIHSIFELLSFLP